MRYTVVRSIIIALVPQLERQHLAELRPGELALVCWQNRLPNRLGNCVLLRCRINWLYDWGHKEMSNTQQNE